MEDIKEAHAQIKNAMASTLQSLIDNKDREEKSSSYKTAWWVCTVSSGVISILKLYFKKEGL